MKICHVDPACGLDIPPKDWGAIEKIIWEFEINQNKSHKTWLERCVDYLLLNLDQ